MRHKHTTIPALTLSVVLAACYAPNPRSCADGLCTDHSFPYCDIEGVLGGNPNECIAVSCTPKELGVCRGDIAVTCNDSGNDYDLVSCPFGCDEAVGGCKMPSGSDPSVRLTYQVASTKVDGAPEPSLAYPPVDGVAVRVGLIDGVLGETEYDASDGRIAFPRNFLDTTWRLEYTIDGVPTEIQWSPLEGHGDLIVPNFGRLDRNPLPQNSGYVYTPSGSNAPTNTGLSAIFTTGLWTRTSSQGQSMPYFPRIPSALSGRDGAPDGTKGDRVITVRYQLVDATKLSIGTIDFIAPSVMADEYTQVIPDPPYRTTPTRSIDFSYVSAPDPMLRLAGALGSRSGTSSSRVDASYIPHAQVPVLAGLGRFGPVDFNPSLTNDQDGLLFAFASVPYGAASTGSFVDSNVLASFPMVAVGIAIDNRSTDSGPLTSSIVSLGSAPGYGIDMTIPLATAPRLSDGLSVVDLASGTDRLPLPVGTGQLDLTFGLDTPAPIDYLEVALHRMDSGKQVRVWIITDVQRSKVIIDRPILEPGVEYVFAIRTHRGRPQAGDGDFRLVAFPQSVGTIYTRTFVPQ